MNARHALPDDFDVSRDRELLGAPPMTFTKTALAQPFADRGSTLLDGWLRLWWIVLRGALQ